MKGRSLIKYLLSAGFLSLFVFQMSVVADTVILYAGNNIEGKVISLDGNVVKISGERGKILINRNKIKQIIFDDEKLSSKTVSKVPEKVNKIDNKKVDVPKKDSKVKTNKVSDNQKVASTNKPIPLRPKVTIKPDSTATETVVSSKDSSKLTISSNQPRKVIAPRVKVTMPKITPNLDYVTYIKGSSSKDMYYGIYSNAPEENNLTVYFAKNTPKKLSYKLHAQKNGKIPPLYTASSIVFIDGQGNILDRTNPFLVDKDNFIEWFSNLENIAGITGDKRVDVQVPQGACLAKVIGYRPGSKKNLVGYISDIRLDDSPIKKLNNN